MERHGSESYFVEGEGLLQLSASGVPEVAKLAMGEAPPFRFSRMGPKGSQLGDANRRKIADAMTTGAGGAGPIPAGFTYLGQFVDHDMTFDNTKGVALGQDVSPAQLLQARSPSLDLDSLYGVGPQNPESAKFYSDGVRLKMGRTEKVGGDPATNQDRDGFDLPRVGAGATTAARRKALIPDPRNDENLAVAQTHLAFIRFHNQVVDRLAAAGTPQAQLFAEARKMVVKHYQWMLRHDFLPRIVDEAILTDVFTKGRKAFEVGVPPTSVPTMPIEFSVAAYRLGHSMIRAAYNWNRIFDFGGGSLFLLFAFSGTSGTLSLDVNPADPNAGGERLPTNWIADFRRLYDFKEAGRQDLAVPVNRFNRAMRIDTLLVDPLRNLPPGSFGGSGNFQNDPRANLAFRNLTRARMVRLATGQKMAAFLRSKGVAITPLTQAQILNGNGGATLGALTTTQRSTLLKDTPLWFYILREAEQNNGRLKGVGGRILAETFHRAMQGSAHSIVRDAAFRPSLGPNNTTFRMVDLLLFAFEGKATQLNPLGN